MTHSDTLQIPRAVADWRPISTAPKDGTNVLLVNADHLIDVAGYIEDSGYWDTAIAHNPTHWTSLPKHPTECI